MYHRLLLGAWLLLTATTSTIGTTTVVATAIDKDYRIIGYLASKFESIDSAIFCLENLRSF